MDFADLNIVICGVIYWSAIFFHCKLTIFDY